MSTLPRAALLSLAIALAACGGGGGGTGAPTPVGSTPPPAAVGPSITTQPVSQTVVAGQSATFAVAADSTATGYQWQRDGKDIPGATGLTYTLDHPQAADNGAKFTAVAKGTAASTTSAAAVLTVSVPKGVVVVAGTPGGPGNLDGADGRISMPTRLTLQPGGPLYLIDEVSGFINSPALRTIDLATGALATVQRDAALGDVVALAVDAAGNRYDSAPTGGTNGIGPRPASAIWRTTPGGQRTLFAGSPEEQGSADGNGTSARFGVVQGFVLDAAGNLYVSDGGKKIRKVAPNGAVVTLAGGGAGDMADGTGAQAAFQLIHALAVDRFGTVTVFDYNAIRRVSPAGVVTTQKLVAPDGSVPDLSAYSLAADAAGNVYALDPFGTPSIRKIAPDGTVTTLASLPLYGVGGMHYTELAIDAAGNLYVADDAGQVLRRITPGGTVTVFAGRSIATANVDATGAVAQFTLPPQAGWDRRFRLATDAAGNVYVGESDRVRKVSRAGVVTTLALPPGDAVTRYYPSSVVADGAVLAVANGVISRIDAGGGAHYIAGQAGVNGTADGVGAKASFSIPTDLTEDAAGNVWLRDVIPGPTTFSDTKIYLRRIAPDGTVTTITTDLQAPNLNGSCRDKTGAVVGADANMNLARIAADGTRTVVRQRRTIDEQLGPIACDGAGNMFVAMAEGAGLYTVRKITPAGTDTVIAGTPGAVGTRAGAPGSLGPIDAITVGADGTVYVMSENALVRILQ
jgi:hypothetical protein